MNKDLQTINLFDEDGNEVVFNVIAFFDVENPDTDEKTEYVIVYEEGTSEDDAFALRVTQDEDGDDLLEAIDDEIEFLNYYTVRQIVEFMDVVLDENMSIYVNNKLADMDTKVYENFSVVWSMATPESEDYEDDYADEAEDVTFTETTSMKTSTEQNSVPADETKTTKEIVTEVVNEPTTQPLEQQIGVIVNGRTYILKGKPEYVFVDVFDYIDFDLTRPQGSGIVTTINKQPAQYMETLKHGDVIEIYWKK